MYEYGQPVIPGLEEFDPQPVLPFEDKGELDGSALLEELDALHTAMVEMELRGQEAEQTPEAIRFDELAVRAMSRGLMKEIA